MLHYASETGKIIYGKATEDVRCTCSYEDLFATVLKEFGLETDDEYSLLLYEHENDYDRVII